MHGARWLALGAAVVALGYTANYLKQSRDKQDRPRRITLVYATLKGTAAKLATKAAMILRKQGIEVQIVNLADYEPDNFVEEDLIAFIVATYEGGQPPASTAGFFKWFEDLALDHRVASTHLAKVKYSVFGLGNSVYADSGNFGKVAKNVDAWMQRLGAQRVGVTRIGDDQDGLALFDTWLEEFLPIAEQHKGGRELLTVEAEPEYESDSADEMEEDYDEEEEDDTASGTSKLTDMEDLGQVYGKKKKGPPGEMLNDRLRASLTKQGYKLIGSHSGVKLCRWTKAQLRGRGGCYKHTFYGIKSYQCMEMTPSLACANKCVFCWRHHSNPVTKEWRWKMDDAEFLVSSSIDQHRGMIKSLKGVPGVIPSRLEEGMQPRHCALSLVGEPIIYPEINTLLRQLHSRGISSFMVTNAQFPDRIDQLEPCTQLYVSIDAATKESLREVDRPIFADFWERFISCIDSLAKKGQRTVFRLTLVKDYNMEELQEYAQLILRGKPDFIEVKGVTYCGDSEASNLTIKNSPYHAEVVRFCQELSKAANALMGDVYEVACEHEHSCCVLIASKPKFLIDGKWNTWIDYDKFHELALAETGNFSSTDYMEETPAWAVFGAEERGFDPAETRFFRKGKAEKLGPK